MENNKSNLPSRLDLELEKLKLTAEQGAQFYTNEKLPLEHEAAFINYIKAYELAAKEKKTIRVFDYLGKPSFPSNPAAEEFPARLEELFDLLKKKKISVSSICEVDDREMYRFITEDLFRYDMIDLGDAKPGTTMFTYEDFYPNDQYDIEHTIRDVLDCIQRKSLDYGMFHFSRDLIIEGKRFRQADFKEMILEFCERYEKIEFQKLTFETPVLLKDRATQEVKISTCASAYGKQCIQDFLAEFRLVRDCGYWDITEVRMPGLKI
jgi:hypothetical protein